MSRFWEDISLNKMSQQQWELLCDGCARCCLVKLEDEDTGAVVNTSIACQLLDIERCRCQDYENRLKRVPMCVKITPETLPDILARENWLPATCSYRLLFENKPLPEWHPLLSGRTGSVHQAGISVKGFALSEQFIHPEQMGDFIIDLT